MGEGGVNMVSAPVVARERGIHIAETRKDAQGAFGSYVRLIVTTESADPVGGGHDLLGRQAALHPDQGDQPGGRADAPHALHHQHRHAGLHRRARHEARRAGVNIATFALGRAEKSGEAIALLGVDEAVGAEALAEIAALPQVRQAKALGF
jgi:D-3-phosphoglycerate dehydrogenase / 2-oxoglutarate reductase